MDKLSALILQLRAKSWKKPSCQENRNNLKKSKLTNSRPTNCSRNYKKLLLTKNHYLIFHNQLAKQRMVTFSILQSRWSSKVAKAHCMKMVLLRLTSLNVQNSLIKMQMRTPLRIILTRASLQLLILVLCKDFNQT